MKDLKFMAQKKENRKIRKKVVICALFTIIPHHTYLVAN